MSAIENVIENGNCIGCGACAFVNPGGYRMTMTAEGNWSAKRVPSSVQTPQEIALLSRTCPMSGQGLLEDEIGQRLFPDLPADQQIGKYRRNLVGHVNGEIREKGGSGGLITWLLKALLERDLVEGVIHVRAAESTSKPLFYEYAMSRSTEDVLSGAKSKYYPITMNEMLAVIAKSNERYAIVGVPCFIKALRLLQDEGILPKHNRPFMIGLICGHLKSRYFAEYLAWQKGVLPSHIESFDFRRKIKGRAASDYGFAVTSDDGAQQVFPMADVKGKDWGEGLLKNPACEFCDDVVAECADIAIGDAWLPGYTQDDQGTNVVVTRCAEIDDLIKAGQEAGELHFDEIEVSDVVLSQSSGLRHRREGLAHRLARRQMNGIWTPRKRVAPRLAKGRRAKIYDVRQTIAERSNAAFAAAIGENNIDLFNKKMKPLIRKYHAYRKPSLFARVRRRLKLMATR